MASTKVIAYVMQEDERDAAADAIDNAQVTDSYVIGDIDEADIPALEARGAVVERVEPSGATPVTAAIARGALAADRGRPGWRAGDDADLPPAQPGVVVQWILTLGGPLLRDMREAIDGTGVRLEEYLPGHGYVTSATPEQATECINLPFVRDVRRFGPSSTGPIEFAGSDIGRHAEQPPAGAWDLWLTEDGRDAVLRWLRDHDVDVLGSGRRKIRIELPPDDPIRQQISVLPGVLTMVEHVEPRLWNDVARMLMRVSGNGLASPYTGEGQIVAVADTGLDAQHPDFQGRIVDVVALGRPGNGGDPNGHGTHVAGSVVADGTASAGQYQGVAPKARLYFQSVLDGRGGLGGLPVALEDLFEPAYLAGARIHNDSWGAPTGSAYTVDSNEVDAYVADRRDMLVVIAAGNDGSAAASINAQPGFVDWLSITSPASSKNALTVGAARSSRTSGGASDRTYGQVWQDRFPAEPIASDLVSGDAECIAAFSSRGPCDDRRIKPDLVAPGTDIVSTRSAAAATSEFWGLVPGNDHYAFMGGTSMAAPLVAGCAALVRQYYATERGIEPSAALVKATLIAGTRWLTGADSVADHPSAPNYHQGFGSVQMSTTLPGIDGEGMRLEFVDSWKSAQLQFTESGQRFRFSDRRRTGPAASAVHGVHRPPEPGTSERHQRARARTRPERRSPATRTSATGSPRPTRTTTSRSCASRNRPPERGRSRCSRAICSADLRTSPSWSPARSPPRCVGSPADPSASSTAATRAAGRERSYRYWPVFDAVSMAREPSDCLPDTRVRM